MAPTNPLAKKSDVEMERAEHIYVKVFESTGDHKLAVQRWRHAIGLGPVQAEKYLPPTVVNAGLAALAKREGRRAKVARAKLSAGLDTAIDFLNSVIDRAKKGKLKGSQFNKAVDAAKFVYGELAGADKGGGAGGSKVPAVALQVNIGGQNVSGMSVRELEKNAADIVLGCSPEGPGGLDSVEPPDQGQAGAASSPAAE